MTAWTFVALLVGIVCLVAGAEMLVRGAASIAVRFGVAPVVIGLTVVAFGTGSPELAVAVSAAVAGSGDVAFGNVAGSNIINILLILGGSALVATLAVTRRIIRIDIPILLAVTVLTFVLALDNEIGRLDGFVLVAGIVAYSWWVIRAARRDRTAGLEESVGAAEELEGELVDEPLAVQAGLVVLGGALLVVGSQLLVGSATDIALGVGVSDLVIGLTVVAVGTSLPELATSLLAAYRGQRDIAVGNVVGSNLFNLLAVFGLTAAVSPEAIPVADTSLQVEFPVMIAATIVLLPIIHKGFEIRRWEGLALVTLYVLYVTFVLLDATDSGVVHVVRPLAFVVTPLVLLGFTMAAVQAARRADAPGG